MSVAVQDNEFFNKIKTGDWLVLFRVSTCYYCAQVADIIEKKILPKYDGLGFIEVDNQLNVELTANLVITEFPTLMLFRNGEHVFTDIKIKGLPDEEVYTRMCTELDAAYHSNGVDYTTLNAMLSTDEDHTNTQQVFYKDSSAKEFELTSFENNDLILSVQIPDGVKEIDVGHFKKCKHLEQIVFSSQMNSIPDAAFYECESLVSVNIPQNISAIGSYAFTFCRNLSSVALHDNMIIGDYAFYGCPYLSKTAFTALSGLDFGKKTMYE